MAMQDLARVKNLAPHTRGMQAKIFGEQEGIAPQFLFF
jgi:hypothetical protein